ncbi:hypothetical protein ABNF97_13895 [Plantactinospora sp. B6F1]|uniref:hypothetical protein n=1 Tax=Plantactinospora sp. B6F1 TaxID=3158971 RepID=UPI0032D97908
MSPWLAVVVLTWVALFVLYLGLAATLHRVNRLGVELAAIRADGGARASGVRLALPALATDPGRTVVLAADSTCSACQGAAAELGERAPSSLLLTYEPPEEWHGTPLTVRQDPESWQRLAHLSPPVLMTVDATGQVVELALPTQPGDVTAALTAWGMVPERSAT